MTPARRLLLVLFLAACGGAGGSTGDRATAPLTPTTRDSAGITIYEHPADALERAPLVTIDSAPLAVFAGDVNDPSKDVSALGSLQFLPSGGLIGYERQDHVLMVLRPSDGARFRRGRHGAGPEEIGSVGSMVVLPGDTVLFVDSNNNRIAVAHPDTGVVRTLSRSAVPELSQGWLVGRVGEALYLIVAPADFTPGMHQDGVANDSMRLGTWRVGDDSVRHQFLVPTGRTVWSTISGTDPRGRRFKGSVGYLLPFAPRTVLAQSGDGFLVARGEHWLLEQWDTAGRLRQEIRIDKPLLPVDDALFERYVEQDAEETAGYMREGNRDPDLDSLRAAVRDRGHADHVAAYDRVWVTPKGTAWVRDVVLPGDSGWAATAIAPDGRLLGRIEMASGEAPIAWGDDRVAFKSEDDNGIATITIKRLRMPE